MHVFVIPYQIEAFLAATSTSWLPSSATEKQQDRTWLGVDNCNANRPMVSVGETLRVPSDQPSNVAMCLQLPFEVSTQPIPLLLRPRALLLGPSSPVSRSTYLKQ